MWLALLLVYPPADAAEIARCEVVLDLPVGRVEVPGFGRTDTDARIHARRAAAALAAWHAHAELVAGHLVDPEAARTRHLQLLETLDLKPVAAAPGYAASDGGCSRVGLPPPRDGDAWSASWAGGPPVVRADPAIAVEAARRRVCFGSFQAALHGALTRAESGAGGGWRTIVTASADARDRLIRCATEAAPHILPAHTPAPHHTGARDDLFQCDRLRREGTGWTTTPGFGHALEDAREAALMRDVLTVAQRAAGDALAARDASAVKDALEPVRTMVVGSDPAEQASLVCVGGPRAQARFAWHPAPGCGTGEEARSFLPSSDLLEELAGSRCWSVSSVGTVRTLGSRTGDRAQDLPRVATGLSSALSCAASCARDLVLEGWRASPTRHADEVDRTSLDAARTAFDRAVSTRDFEAFAVLSGGVLFHPAFATVAERRPDAFWGSLDAARQSGRLDEVATWEEVGGSWVMVFR